MQSSPTVTLSGVSRYHIGIVGAVALALVGSALLLTSLFRAISVGRGASLWADLYYVLSIAVTIISWRVLSSAANKKDFPATSIFAAVFVFVAWYVCETIILGSIVRVCLFFNIDDPFHPPGIGPYIFQVLRYDVQIVIAMAAALSGWKLRTAR